VRHKNLAGYKYLDNFFSLDFGKHMTINALSAVFRIKIADLRSFQDLRKENSNGHTQIKAYPVIK